MKAESEKPVLKPKRTPHNFTIITENIGKIANGDTFARINYLYQIAHAIYPINPILARNYIKEMREIAQKHVTRIDPTIKRTFCKKCNDLYFMSCNTKFEIISIFQYQGIINNRREK